MGRDHAGPTRSIEVAKREGGRSALTAAHLDALAARIEGRLVYPGQAGWDEAVRVWNGLAARVPTLVVQPACAQDVAAAVALAREQGLLLSIKGGGHNIAGTAMAEGGLALDMSRMSGVSVDPELRIARVGPGCRLRDVDRATQEYGLATVLGFVSEVGVAGLTLGGGLGYLTRRFGWTVDNLLEVEIVTADARIRTANRQEDSELFWAVRGAGANLGVVTRFTFRLHEVGPTVYGGLIAWPAARAAEILGAYRTLTVESPRELAVWMILLRAPEAPFVPEAWKGERICAMAVCYSGDLARVDEVLAPIRALGEPVLDLLAAQPYTQLQSYLDATEPKGNHYYWRTEYLSELKDGLLSAVQELLAQCPIPDGEIGILHIGGALGEHAEDDGAVGNRDARYALGVLGQWRPGDRQSDAFSRWIREAWTRIRPFSTGRTYVNFQSGDEGPERIRGAYGANFERLVAVKTKYDPDNVFRVNRNVPPAGDPA